jgi:hypothetical protein
MSVKDLLTFNLFLQLTDGLVSYQAFALGAVEANPVVASAILNWGTVWGLVYNKALACLLLLLIFAISRSQLLLANAGFDPDGIGIRLRHHCLSLATPAIESAHVPFAPPVERRLTGFLRVIFRSVTSLPLSSRPLA